MDFKGFSDDDFDVFSIDGLESRMTALIENIRPKLEMLGQFYSPTLTALTGDEMFKHVAKHARRTKNPPIDTWVAFANNPRGYKMLPHFEIGLWGTHLFIWFAVIYESPKRKVIGQNFAKQIDYIYSSIPSDFVWSTDHTNPNATMHSQLSKSELLTKFMNLQTIKKAEILCGFRINREDVVEMKSSILIKKINEVFQTLIPLYKLSTSI
jgi:uncharacterized protein YktB (UPF0637 family)